MFLPWISLPLPPALPKNRGDMPSVRINKNTTTGIAQQVKRCENVKVNVSLEKETCFYKFPVV